MIKIEEWKIPKFEKKLKEIKKLQHLIENPENDRLLKTHRELEQKMFRLKDKKTLLYIEISKIIRNGWQLLQIKNNNRVCFFKGVLTQAGHPEFHYFYKNSASSTGGIATFKGIEKEELSPKEFMQKLMAGEGFLI